MADDERVPEPGHFLPGGTESDTTGTAGGTTPLMPAETGNRRQHGLGEARPVSISQEPARKKAAPLPDDPEYQGFYGGPPAAPMPGAPTGSLQGSRQLGRVRYEGWKTTSPRTAVQQFATNSAYRKPARQFSQRFVGLISAVALVIVAGGTIAAYAKIDNFGNEVTNPLADPSIKPSEGPQSVAPNPTVTKTIQPVPDAVRLQKNELYKVGKLKSINCPLPKVKPNSKANVLRFYQTLMPCLTETWEPLVLEAGYPFRQPKLVLASKAAPGACGDEPDGNPFYCPADESINVQWEKVSQYYREDPVTITNFLETMAHEYGHHVQQLTNILISSHSQSGFAKTKAAELEWSRRLELQADCLAAVFLSANQKTLFRSDTLRWWKYVVTHSGDELDPKKVRDHGSTKSSAYWSMQGFNSGNPASCNTYAAPAAKVS